MKKKSRKAESREWSVVFNFFKTKKQSVRELQKAARNRIFWLVRKRSPKLLDHTWKYEQRRSNDRNDPFRHTAFYSFQAWKDAFGVYGLITVIFWVKKEVIYMYLGMEELVLWKLAIFIHTFQKSVFQKCPEVFIKFWVNTFFYLM